MEFVAIFSHKYIMHGPGWIFHKSHHINKDKHKFELNDYYFLFFLYHQYYVLFLIYKMESNTNLYWIWNTLLWLNLYIAS